MCHIKYSCIFPLAGIYLFIYVDTTFYTPKDHDVIDELHYITYIYISQIQHLSQDS